MKCFYHSADLDGHCAGAVVKYMNPACKMYPINYGQDFPWAKIEGESVVMVDFSLQPFDYMIKLANMSRLIWIDHHKTATEDYRKYVDCDLPISGLRRDGIGACQLTWEYFSRILNMGTVVPYAIQLLAQYDVWDHSNPHTLPFQYGIRLRETRPEMAMDLWDNLFTGGVDACEDIIAAGEIVLKYEAQTNAKFCSVYAFKTLMPECKDGVKIWRAVCVNKGFTNSKVFDSVWDPEKYDLMITFCRLPLTKKQWTVSLYSDKPEVDCGAIAKSFGGGGHKGAAGFQCDELPFEI